MPSFAIIGILFHRYMNIVIASAQKHGGRFELHSIMRMLLVATLMSCLAILFDDGEYRTETKAD